MLGEPGATAALVTLCVLASASLVGLRSEIEWRGILPVSLLAFFGWAALSVREYHDDPSGVASRLMMGYDFPLLQHSRLGFSAGFAKANLDTGREIESRSFSFGPYLKTRIGDKGLARLKRLKGLKRILARNCQVTLPGVVALSQAIPRIEIFFTGGRYHAGRLELDPPLVEADLAKLSGASSIRVLDLAGLSVSDNAIRTLKSLPALRELELTNCRITDAGLVRIAELGKLNALDLSGTRLTDVGLGPIAQLTELKKLKLARVPVGNDGVAHLAKLTKLQQLSLSGTRIGGNALAHLTKLESLTVLDLSSTPITDNTLQKYITPRTGLRALGLRDTNITNGGMKHLKPLDKLEVLWLSRTSISNTGLAQLASLKSLHTLELRHTRIGNTDKFYRSPTPLRSWQCRKL